MTEPSADLRARILAGARAEASPTRAVFLKRRVIAMVLSVAWIALASAFWASRKGMPVGPAAAMLGLWAAAALGVSFFVLRSPNSSLGRPRALLAILGPAVGALVLALALGMAATVGPVGGSGEGHHGGCWMFTILVALVPLAAALWVERGSDPIAPGASGAALGAMAGAWAGIPMSFLCGRTEPLHVFLGHVLSMLVVVALAAIAGKRLLALR